MIFLTPKYDICPLCGGDFIARKVQLMKNNLSQIINIILQECQNPKCKFEFLEEPEDMDIKEAKRIIEDANKEYSVKDEIKQLDIFIEI